MNAPATRDVILFSHASNKQLYAEILPIPVRRRPSDLTRSLLELAREAKANLTGVDLAKQDLSDLDLSGLKMNDGLFHETNLSGAKLMAAQLKKASFEGAQLGGADLSGADLRHAALSGVDLRGAKLEGADLRHAAMDGADLRSADPRRAKFENATLREANLEGADLGGAIFTYCVANGVNFTDVQFDGIEFYMADLKQVTGLPDGGRKHAQRTQQLNDGQASILQFCPLRLSDSPYPGRAPHRRSPRPATAGIGSLRLSTVRPSGT